MSITLGESFGCDNNNNNIRNNNNYIAKICDGDGAGDSDSAGDKTINNYTINYDSYKKLQQEQEEGQEKPRRNKLFLKLGKINVSATTPPPPPLPLETKTEKSNERESESGRERDKSTEYYYQHRDQKLEYQKKYNRQKGDAIKGYNKSYYMKRREEILEKARTKVTCECGCVVQLFNMNSHKKTKKHVRYLEMRQAMTAATALTIE